MHSRTRIVAAFFAATALILAGLTGTAAAKSNAAHAVGTHVKRSQVASKRFSKLAHKGDVKAARSALRSARHEAVTAARQARTVAATVENHPANADQAIWALLGAAGNFGDAISSLSSLIPGIGNLGLQNDTAGAVAGSVAGHDQLVAILQQFVTQLTGGAQTLAAQALAALQAATPEQISGLATITAPADLPAAIQSILQTALGSFTSALNSGVGILGDVLGQLPDGVQGQIAGVLQSVTGIIGQIMPIVSQVTQTVFGTVQSILTQVMGIVSSVFGSHDSSDDDSGSGSDSHSGGLLGGLLGPITGLIPGFGGMFGNLFGGLL
jgi:phage-related protein